MVLLSAACRPLAEGTPFTHAATASPSPTLEVTPEPTATATPTDAPPPTPVATATESPPSPEVRAFTERALVHLEWLAGSLGIRASTSPQEREAAEYIAGQLEALGYETELQEFAVAGTQDVGQDLKVVDPDLGLLDTTILIGSAMGDATGPLTFVGLGREEDIPLEGLEGRVAFVERGAITFRAKALNAQRAGAVGVVVFNNESGILRGTLSETVDIPVLGISQAAGQSLLILVRQQEVTVMLNTVREERTSQNVVATLGRGRGPIVVLGAHYDSVPESPGANDNASGTAALLVLAQELVDRDLALELRIIAFGSEELGLLGSSHYVRSLPQGEVERIAAMVNFDALASGTLGVGGSGALVEQVLAGAEKLGIRAAAAREPPGASSDHASFLAAGVPVVFISGSEFSRIHSPADVIEAVDLKLLGQSVVLGLELVISLEQK